MWLLGRRRGDSPTVVEKIVNDALAPVCAIILLTGAGGMFGGVLRASGIGQALGSSLENTGMPVIVAALVISLALRLAQGSATVALTTAAALIAPAVEATSGLSSADLALIVIAIAGGGDHDLPLDVLPGVNAGDSCRAAHAAPRWVPASPGPAGTSPGLTSPPQAAAARPAARMFRAALPSRSCTTPHAQVHSRTASGFGSDTIPHAEQSRVDGNHLSTLTTVRP